MRNPGRFSLANLWPFRRSPSPPPGPSPRPYSIAQIEVTSRCNMECTFCALRPLAGRWIGSDMPLSLYREQIAPHLGLFELVYLQGWGEPLLHPGFWEMARLAKEKGCRTGFTTNGAHLDDYARRQVLDIGVELLSISFAGARRETHSGLRTRSDWENLLRNVEQMAELKAQENSPHPWLEIHFLMNAGNLGELPDLVRLAAKLGADEVVATNLTYTPTLELDDFRAFGRDLPGATDITREARRVAENCGMRLTLYPLEFEDQVLVCDARPHKTTFINQQGEVTPCVLLGLNLHGDIPRYYFGEAQPVPPVSFGSVCQGLPQVMEGPERRAFIEPFLRREAAAHPLASFAYLLEQQQPDLPDPPEPCRHCYKLLGV